MGLFAVGNILLKLKRSKLARPFRASWLSVILGLAGVVAALIGNAVLNPSYLAVFLEFLFPALIVVGFMLERIALFETGLFLIHSIMATLSTFMGRTIGKINGRNIYLASPEYMGEYARRLAEAGASVIGGCCGTTPAHIRAMRNCLQSVRPSPHIAVQADILEEGSEPETVPRGAKSALGAVLESGRKARLVELHYFGGLTYDEMADATRLSTSQIHRDLRSAKAWLKVRLAH